MKRLLTNRWFLYSFIPNFAGCIFLAWTYAVWRTTSSLAVAGFCGGLAVFALVMAINDY